MLKPRCPRSVVQVSRTEHTALPLDVVEGTYPNDLHGHLFVASPANTLDTPSDGRRTTLMVGDGLISRFDLGGAGATVTSRLSRTHDFVADELTHGSDELRLFRFGDAGLVRLGLLGTRDFANTAFVPMKTSAGPSRMILTYDAGKPVEIDPSTLEVVTPVGRRADWRAEALPDAVFPVVLSPAHPAYDARTEELFTVNYGRGVGNFAATVPLVHLLEQLPLFAAEALDRLAAVVGVERAFRWLVRNVERFTTRLDRRVEAFVDRYLPFVPDTFTDLVRWDGAGAFERWRLALPGGREVSIEQSIHQIAVTERHVLVLETGFKIGLQSAFNDPVPRTDAIDRLARAILTRPQLPCTVLYVVPRASLERSDLPIGDDGVRRVRCRRVEIPLEADHFLADYDDADGITVHVAHSPATDLSEWIRPYDRSAYDGRAIAPELHGMLAVGAMDVGRLGRYVIDGASGEVLESKVLVDEPVSWALALYAGREINTDDPLPLRIENLYWCSEGAFPELLTEFVYDLYETYPHRLASLEAIRDMGQSGRPSAILRVHTPTMTIADRCVLPDGVMAGSLQFVPRAGGSGTDTDGYLVGTVYTDARTEVWILDAADLSAGPVCKLASSAWGLGFSLHTAWVPSVAPRTASYRVTAREDLSSAVDALALDVRRPALRRRFEDDLYPRFE